MSVPSLSGPFRFAHRGTEDQANRQAGRRTGEAPFDGESAAEAVDGHRTAEVAWPSDIREGVSERASRLIARMMAKDPDERYRTPTELILDLRIVKAGQDPVIAAAAPSGGRPRLQSGGQGF